MRKHGLVTEQPDLASNEAPELDALETCTKASLGLGLLARVDDGDSAREVPDESEPLRPSKRGKGRHYGEAHGFSIHAGVCVAAGNAYGREVLLRYCARPPLALGRLSKLADGRFAYRLKKPWGKQQTHVLFTPTELLARLSSLIPPPRSPLTRFHGAFAAHFRDRAQVVKESELRTTVEAATAGCASSATTHPAGPCRMVDTKITSRDSPEPVDGGEITPETRGTAVLARDRMENPALQSAEADDGGATRTGSASPWRIDWHTLLQRIYDVDSLACPCGGRLRFLELVTSRHEARAVLTRLGLDTEPPPVASRSGAPDPVDDVTWNDAWDP